MTAFRRLRDNFALERACEHARALDRPLLVLEPLRCGYAWACDRFHAFILAGMRDNAAQAGKAGVGYYPYVELRRGAGKGLLATLAARACVVVTDDHPGFFHPRMLAAAARALDVRLEAVDSNGLLPIRLAGRAFARAHDFRRFLQKELPGHLERFPARAALRSVGRAPLPRAATARWPAGIPDRLDGLPIEHAIAPLPGEGGPLRGERLAREFVSRRLGRYADDRNAPGRDATSGLSGYLHFGHVSSHFVARAILEASGWDPGRIGPRRDGGRTGWWGLDEPAEAFLDQLVTWRELGFNAAVFLPGYEGYAAQPEWAKRTLEAHRHDEREHIYGLEQLARARTHDELWNAAQRQLVREGRIHNYLRMLWGKRVLEWTESPERAAEVLVELNNRYAIDGRDPNSYSGIFWVLGRYDRAWGPERPVFGKVRYMSSANTRRKLDVNEYLARYAEDRED